MTLDSAVADVATLLSAAAPRIAAPREEPGDSFVLHAPLETLARVGLLDHVAADERAGIVERIRATAATYDTYRAWPRTAAPSSIADEATARRTLVAGIAATDFDAVDDAVRWLSARLDTDELVVAIADPIVASLAAAAHGAIFAYLLPRVAARQLPAAAMLRTTAHELARHPEWRLSWFDHRPSATAMPSADAAVELERRLARPPSVTPASDMIQPTMDAVEQAGLATDLLGDLVGVLTVRDARHALVRTAARSMLQDDTDGAPYTWSHCLTMPQATLGIARSVSDRVAAIAVAATYVLGFRSTCGLVAVEPDWEPERPSRPITGGLDLGATPGEVAAVAWYAPPDARPAIWRQLAAHAGAHRDAHLAKYTLASLDATRGDPGQESLYLAAAAFLNAWWCQPSR
ncbi:MAG: hypothetical protein ACK5OX_03720 [Desertimonas sp.]